MTPQLITDAITKALEVGAATGLTAISKTVIGDAYSSLKSLINAKLGASSESAKAIEALEAKPDSNGRQETLTEELTSIRIATDAEVVSAVQNLLQLIRGLPPNGSTMQIGHGTGIAQASHGGSATALMYAPLNPDKDV